MKTYISSLAFAFLSIILFSGCGTITRGSKDTLVIESDPSGAKITLSNGLTGTTPAAFQLPRKESVVVKITKEGFNPVEINVIPSVSTAGGAAMAGNVLVGGLIGAAVDANSGAMKDLKPNPIKVKLDPITFEQKNPIQPPRPVIVEEPISDPPKPSIN